MASSTISLRLAALYCTPEVAETLPATRSPNWRSISGYAFLYPGGAISWMSKQQSTVASSLAHAEYIVAAETSKELVVYWSNCARTSPGRRLYTLTAELSIYLHENPVNHASTKHIDVRYRFINSIDLKLIGTNDRQQTYSPSPSLARIKHERFCRMLGMELTMD